jgi:hypothetical protein
MAPKALSAPIERIYKATKAAPARRDLRTNKVRSRDRLYGAQGVAFLRMAVARWIAANVAKLPELLRK